jgi:hypothetical protein
MEPSSRVVRPTGVRRSFLALLLALLGLTLLAPSGPAVASCAAPSVEVSGPLEAGTAAEVEGRGFVDGCRDSMSCPAFGCGDCEFDDPPEQPYDDVELRLEQGGRTWVLATADAGSAEDDRLGQVRWTFTVPDDVAPGRARLVTDQSGPVRVRVATAG